MKKKIVIASVLKPIDDVRSYWKLSQSMAKTNKYEVNIIGNEGKKESYSENIKFHAHQIRRRNWTKRILIRPLILINTLKIKPSLFIITTHELIMTAVLVKWLIRCKVVYDVQENYQLNLAMISSSPLRKVLGTLVRLKEKLSKKYIDQYWLAESCYHHELPFTKGKALTLENKAFKYSITKKDSTPLRLLFSGTISEYSGVKKAVKLFKECSKTDILTHLHIIGQVHNKALMNWLILEKDKNPSIKLTVSENPVPYQQILEAMSNANLGVIGYEPNLVNKEKIPTKLYEYSRYHLPYLVQANTKWSEIGTKLGGAIPTDFDNPNCKNLVKIIKNSASLFPKIYPNQSTWEFESTQLIVSLNTLIS